MKNQISLREASQHLSKYIYQVEVCDTEIIITCRGKPVARLSPLEKEKKKLTHRQSAALERTLRRMKKGLDLGGKKFNRDELYEK